MFTPAEKRAGHGGDVGGRRAQLRTDLLMPKRPGVIVPKDDAFERRLTEATARVESIKLRMAAREIESLRANNSRKARVPRGLGTVWTR